MGFVCESARGPKLSFSSEVQDCCLKPRDDADLETRFLAFEKIGAVQPHPNRLSLQGAFRTEPGPEWCRDFCHDRFGFCSHLVLGEIRWILIRCFHGRNTTPSEATGAVTGVEFLDKNIADGIPTAIILGFQETARILPNFHAPKN